MATEIRFADRPSLTVAEAYRDVYEKLLVTDCQLPCAIRRTNDDRAATASDRQTAVGPGR